MSNSMESRDIQVFNHSFTISPEQEEMLKQPLKADQIKERKGFGGTWLKYIKGDTAIDAANRIFGFGRWGYRIIGREHCIVEDDKKGKIEYYTCDIELSVAGAAFTFPGDGMGIVTSPFTIEMHEKARKEATTDALKRALRHYGDQFGLSLYNEDDYLDLGDGTLAKVKEVKTDRGQGSQGGRQVVDSQPPDPTIKASNQGLYNAALQAKIRAKKLGITDDAKWEALLDLLGIKEFATGADIAKLNSKLTEIEKKRTAQSA